MSAVLDKIRAETPKNGAKLVRPRVSGGRVDNGKVEKLQELLSPKIPAAVKVWVSGLKANICAYDRTAQKIVDTGLPDHKIRADCARSIVEYVVGKAIERSLEVSGSYKELSQVLEELQQSPEARRLLPSDIWNLIPGAPAPSVEEKPVEQNPQSAP
jgi:hypothetical protein